MDSLDLKRAKSLILGLYGTPIAKKSDLFGIVKSHQVLDSLLEALRRDGYIDIESSEKGPKKYTIKLTPKGRAVAEQLKKADEIARGNAPEKGILNDELLLLLDLFGREKHDFASLNERYGYSTIEKLKDLRLIEQELDNKAYPPKSFLKITEKGRKVAKHLKEIEGVLEEGK